jgi:hypothetical protein
MPWFELLRVAPLHLGFVVALVILYRHRGRSRPATTLAAGGVFVVLGVLPAVGYIIPFLLTTLTDAIGDQQVAINILITGFNLLQVVSVLCLVWAVLVARDPRADDQHHDDD